MLKVDEVVTTLDSVRKELMQDSIGMFEMTDEMLGLVAGGNVGPGRQPTVAESGCGPDGRPRK